MEQEITDLIESKKKLAEIQAKYNDAKLEVVDRLSIIRAKLDELKLKSAKTNLGTVSMVNKQKLVVMNERSVLGWIDDNPQVDKEVYLKLDKKAFDGLYKQWYADTGELIDGVAVEEVEYLSFRQAK